MPEPGQTPVVVVLATANRAESLRQTLESMVAMDTAGLDWQLWVADNGSSDNTSQVLQAFSDRLPLHAVHVPERGKNRALNRVLQRVSASLVVFTDDDVIVDAGWLRAFVDAADAHPDHDIFAGRVIPEFPAQAPDWLRNPAYGFSRAAFARFDLGEQSGSVQVEPFGPSFAVRGSRMAGHAFDEAIGPGGQHAYICGGETELLRRLINAGATTYYVAPARVRHQVRSDQLSIGWLLSRAYRLGRGHAYMQLRDGQAVPGRAVWRLRRSLPWSWLRWKLASLFGAPQTEAKRGETVAFRRGQLDEYRRAEH